MQNVYLTLAVLCWVCAIPAFFTGGILVCALNFFPILMVPSGVCLLLGCFCINRSQRFA